MDTIAGSPVHALAHAALRRLRRDRADRVTVALPSGEAAEIAYRGPGRPDRLPGAIADYDMVRLQAAGWSAAHRLVVTVPLIVLDLAWNGGEPVRILTFCRGDWEQDLLEELA